MLDRMYSFPSRPREHLLLERKDAHIYKYCPYFPPRSDSLLLLQITKIFPWPHSRSLSLLHIFRIFLHDHTPSCFFNSQKSFPGLTYLVSFKHIFGIFLLDHTPSCFFKSQKSFPGLTSGLLHIFGIFLLDYTPSCSFNSQKSFPGLAPCLSLLHTFRIFLPDLTPSSLQPGFFTKISCTMSNHSHQVKTLTPAGILVFQSTNAICTAAHRRSWQIYLNRRRLFYMRRKSLYIDLAPSQ